MLLHIEKQLFESVLGLEKDKIEQMELFKINR
jgi:hypothetical protein